MTAMKRWQEGYLYPANSSWHVRYYASGKQKSKRLCDRDLPKKAVRKAFTEFMAEVNGPGHLDTPDLTVVEFWEQTYWPFLQENLKASTVYGYKYVWSGHLKAHFGETLLKEYRTPMGSVFLTKLSKTFRPATIQNIKNLASGIFQHAVNVGVVENNPWHDVKVLGKKLDAGATEVYSLEEIENIISALVDRVDCQLIMALSYFAGLRHGEIAALQWGDIDSDFIHIRRAVVRGVVGTPKTKKSIRSIPLIQPLRGLLMLWRAKNPLDEKWLFKGRNGNPFDLHNIGTLIIKPALAKVNLKYKGFHAGRRGTGTILRQLTGNSNAGRDLLGHTTSKTTEDHYEGAMPQEVLTGMRLLEQKVVERK